MTAKRKIIIIAAVLCAALIAVCVVLFPYFLPPAPPSGTIDLNRCPVFVDSPAGNLSSRYDELKEKLCKDDSCTLTIEENGRLSFYSGHTTDPSSPGLTVTEAEAIAAAEQTLRELDLLPRDSYRTRVSGISSTELDLEGGGSADSVITEYWVSFYRTYNGVDVVSKQEDGIMLWFDANGLKSLQYFWRDVKVIAFDSEGMTPLTTEQVYQIYIDNWDERHGSCCDPEDNPVFKQAYLHIDGITRPCWVIAEDSEYLNAWWIDMLTGEILV